MRCPSCNQTDAFYGFMGWNCMNILCEHFKNGRSSAINSQPATKEFQINDQVLIDVGYLMYNDFSGSLKIAGIIKNIYSRDDGSKTFRCEYTDTDGRFATLIAFEDTISHL